MRVLGVECFKEQLSKYIACLIIFTFPFLQKSSVLQNSLNFYKNELRLYICDYAFVNMPLYVYMHMHAYRETYRYNSMPKNQRWVLDISQETFVNFVYLLSATEKHLSTHLEKSRSGEPHSRAIWKDLSHLREHKTKCAVNKSSSIPILAEFHFLLTLLGPGTTLILTHIRGNVECKPSLLSQVCFSGNVK